MLLNPYRFATGASDPYWSSVVLLLHMDGADGSTTFTDHSSSAKTVTANGNAQIDTAQSKFGGSSLLLDGTGDYLSIPDSNDWDFGTGDFTIEGFVYFSAKTGFHQILCQYQNPPIVGWHLRYNTSGSTLQFYWGDTQIANISWTPSTNTWYHVAVCRAGTSLRLFVDGTQIGSTVSNSTNMTGSGNALLVGALFFSSAYQQFFNGYIDEVRITKGVARYTAAFTPPSSAFPNQ